MTDYLRLAKVAEQAHKTAEDLIHMATTGTPRLWTRLESIVEYRGGKQFKYSGWASIIPEDCFWLETHDKVLISRFLDKEKNQFITANPERKIIMDQGLETIINRTNPISMPISRAMLFISSEDAELFTPGGIEAQPPKGDHIPLGAKEATKCDTLATSHPVSGKLLKSKEEMISYLGMSMGKFEGLLKRYPFLEATGITGKIDGGWRVYTSQLDQWLTWVQRQEPIAR